METKKSTLISVAASLIPLLLSGVSLAFTEEVTVDMTVTGESLDDSSSNNTQQVYGTATATTINSGGVQAINPGGVVESSVVNTGGTLLNNGGRDNNTVVNSGGTFTIAGQADAIAVSDNATIGEESIVEIDDYVQTNNWTINKKIDQYIYLEGEHSIMTNTLVNSGRMWLKSGRMVATTLNSGNFVNVAGTDIDTVINGGVYIIGGETNAYSENLTINEKGYGNLNSGVITDATINGSLNVSPNKINPSILSSLRGNIVVNDTGRLNITTGSDTGDATYTSSGVIFLATNASLPGSFSFALGDTTLTGGTISFETVGYSTLTLSSLAGTGDFRINTKVDELKGDFINVTGNATGSFDVYVNDQGASPTSDDSLQVIQIGSGDATFSLGNSGNVVDLGTYQYYLVADGQGGWSLTPQSTEPDPTPDPDPEPGTDDDPTTDPEPGTDDDPTTDPDDNPTSEDDNQTDPATPAETDSPDNTGNQADTSTDVTPVPTPSGNYSITPATAEVLSIATADPLIFRQELEMVSERLAGVDSLGHDRDVWGTVRNSRLNVSNEAGADYRMNVNALTIGADRMQRNENSLAVEGLFFSYSHSDMRFRGKGIGKADIDSWSGGVYGLWQHDNGYWLDGTLKLNRFVHDVRGRMTSGGTANGRFNTVGIGSNIKAGKTFQVRAATVTPFVSLTGFTGKSSNLALNNGMKAHIGPQRSLLVAAGVRAEYAFKVKQAELRPWASISLEQETVKKNRVKVNNDWFKNDLSGGRGVYQAGVRAELTPALSTHVGVGYMEGKHIESPWSVTAGVSWRF